MMVLAAFLAVAQTDGAGNALEALFPSGPAPMEPGEGSGLHCSARPRWCVSTAVDDSTGWRLLVRGGDGARQEDIPLPSFTDRTRYVPWPHLVRNADGSVLVGVLRSETGGFAGGGWRKTHLVLIRAADTGTRAVLELPFEASASIRACFDDRARSRRREACTDDYAFATTLAPGTGDAASLPVLNVSTTATTYPGRRSRTEDSRQRPPLSPRDLVRWTDPVCSYTRAYRFDAAAGRYQPENPVPACDDYLDFE